MYEEHMVRKMADLLRAFKILCQVNLNIQHAI